jgi:hypothetical protein
MASTEGAERSLEGEAGKEIGWERRASCGEYGFGRHREIVYEHEAEGREL